MTIEAASTKAGSTHKQRRIINLSSINSNLGLDQRPQEAGKTSGECPGIQKTVTAQNGQITLPILIGNNCQSSKQPRPHVDGHGNIGCWKRFVRKGVLLRLPLTAVKLALKYPL